MTDTNVAYPTTYDDPVRVGQVDRLKGLIDRFESFADRLAKELSHGLRPTEPHTIGPVEVRSPCSDLAAELDRLEDVFHRLSRVADRIDL